MQYLHYCAITKKVLLQHSSPNFKNQVYKKYLSLLHFTTKKSEILSKRIQLYRALEMTSIRNRK